jgi:hypothetical protein
MGRATCSTSAASAGWSLAPSGARSRPATRPAAFRPAERSVTYRRITSSTGRKGARPSSRTSCTCAATTIIYCMKAGSRSDSTPAGSPSSQAPMGGHSSPARPCRPCMLSITTGTTFPRKRLAPPGERSRKLERRSNGLRHGHGGAAGCGWRKGDEVGLVCSRGQQRAATAGVHKRAVPVLWAEGSDGRGVLPVGLAARPPYM